LAKTFEDEDLEEVGSAFCLQVGFRNENAEGLHEFGQCRDDVKRVQRKKLVKRRLLAARHQGVENCK